MVKMKGMSSSRLSALTSTADHIKDSLARLDGEVLMLDAPLLPLAPSDRVGQVVQSGETCKCNSVAGVLPTHGFAEL